MEFTKQQLNLFANFYNASLENEKDFDNLENLLEEQKKLEEKISETIKKTQVRNIIILGILKGILLEKSNTPLLKAETKNLLIQGGDNMQYQGVKIIKNKYCNTWTARPTVNGKQIYISAKTQQDCYNKLKNKLKQKTTTTKQIKTISITFKEWFKKWLNLYKTNIKDTTKKDYESSLNYLKEINNKQIKNITSIDIIEQLNKINYPRRKQKVYELLNDIFKKAIINNYITTNPIQTINKPKHKKINGLALTSEDEIKIENIFKNKNLDIFLICLYQGLRKGEVLALTIKDIDFEKKTININKSINSKNEIDTTKNIYSNRIMPLFEKSSMIFKKYINKENRIFNIPYSSTEKIFNKIIKESFNKKYTIHSLRHTFITKCQEKQIPLHIIQKWVGHNIGSTVTNQVYTHTRELAELENIEKMNK